MIDKVSGVSSATWEATEEHEDKSEKQRYLISLP